MDITEEQAKEAIDLLKEIHHEDSLAPHRNESCEMHHTSARLFALMNEIGEYVDQDDLQAAIDRLKE